MLTHSFTQSLPPPPLHPHSQYFLIPSLPHSPTSSLTIPTGDMQHIHKTPRPPERGKYNRNPCTLLTVSSKLALASSSHPSCTMHSLWRKMAFHALPRPRSQILRAKSCTTHSRSSCTCKIANHASRPHHMELLSIPSMSLGLFSSDFCDTRVMATVDHHTVE